MKSDDLYIRRSIKLAQQAMGFTAPNPLVGAVIVYENKIIAEGFHKNFGGLHAEADAIRKVNDNELLKKSILYVNLEPCSHKGKTPPCAELIVKSGIPRVVIGTLDPNSLVSGNGVRFLEEMGVQVKTRICEESCIDLNRRFFTFHVLKRPYVILKWAQTSDGFIDMTRTTGEKTGINWISNELSRMLVHKWRSEEQAIMVGTNTALLDNPLLNTRHWHGHSPLRIITDRNLRLPLYLHIFDKSLPTLILNEQKSGKSDNLEYVKIKFNEDFFKYLMKILFERDIQSLIVEGGKMLLESFIQHNLWDEGRVFIGQKKFFRGLAAPTFAKLPVEKSFIQSDQLLIFRNTDPYLHMIKKGLKEIIINK